jgi:hypothetical protein
MPTIYTTPPGLFWVGGDCSGADFSYIFFGGKSLSAENSVEFLGKIIFQNFFPWKIPFFPNIFFWGGGEFSLKFSPEKMYEKSAPGLTGFWFRGHLRTAKTDLNFIILIIIFGAFGDFKSTRSKTCPSSPLFKSSNEVANLETSHEKVSNLGFLKNVSCRRNGLYVPIIKFYVSEHSTDKVI